MQIKQNISAEQAKKLLIENKPLINFHISGILNMSDFDINDKMIHIENCFVENFKSEAVIFTKNIELIKSEFKKCTFSFAQFLGGLKINKCMFHDYLDFQCGGHNSISNVFMIKDTVFNGFVNFTDCIYHGPVEILNNVFKKGTNLLGNKGSGYETVFEIPPHIENNKGKTDLNDEGDLRINLVDLT